MALLIEHRVNCGLSREKCPSEGWVRRALSDFHEAADEIERLRGEARRCDFAPENHNDIDNLTARADRAEAELSEAKGLLTRAAFEIKHGPSAQGWRIERDIAGFLQGSIEATERPCERCGGSGADPDALRLREATDSGVCPSCQGSGRRVDE